MRPSELQELIDEAKALLRLDEQFCATSRVVSVGTFSEQVSSPNSSTGCGSSHRGAIITAQAHELFDFDQVRVNLASSSRSLRAQRISTLSVVNVASPQVAEVEVQGCQPQALMDSTISLPLNMHKLAREVLIPMTTVQERILHLTDVQDVRRLFDCLDPATRVVTECLRLPGSDGTMVVVGKGMSIHGSLSRDGVVRRNYWSLGGRRSERWKRSVEDDVESGHEIQPVFDWAPEGFAETEQWITRQQAEEQVSSTGGVYVVLGKGESWSESVRRARRITDFISHNWSGSCKDLVDTLVAARVRTAWICTLAVNQHAVPSLSGPFCNTPFYQALDQMQGKGRVVMVLDRDASTLTRIWCIFEVWVSTKLQLDFQMYLPSGEVNFFSDSHECKYARNRILDLNLQNTKYSRREDYDMIMRIIEDSPGGQDAVLWQVKRILSTSAIVLVARLVEDTSTSLVMWVWAFEDLDPETDHDVSCDNGDSAATSPLVDVVSVACWAVVLLLVQERPCHFFCLAGGDLQWRSASCHSSLAAAAHISCRRS